ncbi:MAG: calcium-transporting P-type ATPase, PMR1-type [Chloroflexota bacterium]|nr:MAG: calcium-transporting P-type ATPase, PMR1-type [Chloroflexota bacterium]
METNKNWHNLDISEVLASLSSDRNGISNEEAQHRLAQFGPNELAGKERVSPWAILLEQFKNFLIIILLVAVALSAITGEIADAIVILVIVLFAAGLGFIQEYRAERAMEALKRMAAPTASVLRGGKEIEVTAHELVPGDIIFLKTGDRIPADARLIEAVNLKVEEASLTGESVPVEKTNKVLPTEISVGDRKNMVFMGTAAVYGRGMAVITGTGMITEFGKIATMLQEVKKEQTPLQINLDQLGKWIGIGALALCFILAGIGVLRGHEILEMLIWGVSLAVAAVPEALPAVVTISLALGVQRMVRRNALIRKLPAVETLGSTTFICSDKTGTLTQDQMTIRRIYVEDKLIDVTGVGYEPKGEFTFDDKKLHIEKEKALQMLLQIGSLCNDTTLKYIDGTWKIKGDPTEGALVVTAAKANLWQDKLQSQFPRIHEIPFSSETKRMTTVHQTTEGRTAYAKGAPEVILNSCSHIYQNGQEIKLNDDSKGNILSVSHKMAEDALRVLGLAYKRLPDTADTTASIEEDMVFAGLVGMIDPPREEVKEAVKLCDQAGIKSVMITGDHKLTAVAIAKELGILKKGVALSGTDIDNISDEEFEAMVEKIEVYARVSPAHKLRVVEALTKRGHIVAMTGDGVNDAPALKKSDIGVAMGITGTDVSKEAADMVLTDDNFASIVAAVEEGRGIFGNIKKYLVYLLSCNLGEILLMAIVILFGPLFGLPAGTIPLTAIQILYVNLATDGLPAIALSVDPPELDIMNQKPRPRKQSIFTGPVLRYLTSAGIWTTLVALAVFLWALSSGRDHSEAQTMCFVTLILVQFFNAFNCRSLEYSLFKIGPFANKWLLLAIGWECIMLGLVVYLPFLQGPFNTYALTLTDWTIAILSASTIFIAAEIYKLISSLLRPKGVAPASTG